MSEKTRAEELIQMLSDEFRRLSAVERERDGLRAEVERLKAEPYPPKVWTGEELLPLLMAFKNGYAGGQDVMDAINAANGVKPQPDPREELRKQIVWTNFPQDCSVGVLGKGLVTVSAWSSMCYDDRQSAITAAENRLIDRAITERLDACRKITAID